MTSQDMPSHSDTDEEPLEIDPLAFNPNDFQLVDIREESEVKEEPLRNFPFVHHPLSQFQVEILDRDKAYLFFCRSGKRSLHLVTYLRRVGFKKVYSLPGGLAALT